MHCKEKFYFAAHSTETGNHIKAVLQALFVTFLWSSSWVLIKVGISTSLPAITFAGLRYSIAVLCLLPFIFLKNSNREALRKLTVRDWRQLFLLGIIFYSLTQGAQFLSLSLLPAAAVSLLLNLTPMIVALYTLFSGNEQPSLFQWSGIVLSFAGIGIYFLPLKLPTSANLVGLIIATIGLLANSGSSLLGRKVNQSNIPAIIVTFISMGTGAIMLLITGIAFQGLNQLTSLQWIIILWLAIINTAFAFSLWNITLRTLSAVESSILNNTMLPQIALLAYLFLDEPLNSKQMAGIFLVVSGTLIVQLWKRKQKLKAPGLEKASMKNDFEVKMNNDKSVDISSQKN